MKKILLLVFCIMFSFVSPVMANDKYNDGSNMGAEIVNGIGEVLVGGVANPFCQFGKEINDKGFFGIFTGIGKFVVAAVTTTPASFVDGVVTIATSPFYDDPIEGGIRMITGSVTKPFHSFGEYVNGETIHY